MAVSVSTSANSDLLTGEGLGFGGWKSTHARCVKWGARDGLWVGPCQSGLEANTTLLRTRRASHRITTILGSCTVIFLGVLGMEPDNKSRTSPGTLEEDFYRPPECELKILEKRMRDIAPRGSSVEKLFLARIAKLESQMKEPVTKELELKELELKGLETKLAATPDRYPYLRSRISSKIEGVKKEIVSVKKSAAPSRMPTRYEEELMISLGFDTLEELEEFLNLPTRSDLGMHPPYEFYEASSREDKWIDDHWIDDKAEDNAAAPDFSALSGREFEQLIVDLLSRMGFQADLTATTGDGGIDVVATLDKPITGGRYLIQCKRYRLENPVGAPTLRDFYGAVAAERGLKGVFITTSDFTVQARQFAEKAGVELIGNARLRKLLIEFGLGSGT